MNFVYQQTTQEIEVTVAPRYLAERSSPQDDIYVWGYKIEIANHGEAPVQLQSRQWRIADCHGYHIEVTGPGVVGAKPTINPGETYQYTSVANLSGPSGIMAGSYQMVDEAGKTFEVGIPTFSLDSPQQVALPN